MSVKAGQAQSPQDERDGFRAHVAAVSSLRVNELAAADLANLGHDCGHRVLQVTSKGSRKAKVAITPATGADLDDYLTDRAHQARMPVAELFGPLVATRTGGRLSQGNLWELIRRLAKTADIASWEALSPTACATPPSPRHSTPGSVCATSRTTPATATPAPPAATTTPDTTSTAPPPTPSPPT